MEEQGDQEQREVRADEGWKKAVAEEKARAREQDAQPAEQAQEAAGTETGPGPGRTPFPEPSIQVFLAGLYAQTIVSLGEMENPVTGKRTTDIEEAAYLVDTIAMLQQKTKGNLTPEEDAYVQNILTDLRLRYVKAKKPAAQESGGADPGGS